jgi:RNA polymerase sigma-70 factor, ECF subfamily
VILQFILYITGFAFQSADEEREWMKHIQSGNKLYLSKLYHRYHRILFGMIYNVLRKKEESEDLLQEVFVQAWEKSDQYDPSRGTVYSFLVTMARNKAIDMTRSKAYKNHAKEDHIINDFTLELQHDNPNPHEEIELDERAAKVRSALSRLKKDEREVLYISYFHGLSQSEISEKMKIPLGTVKYRMRQGMIKLRDMLSEAAV